MMRAGKAFIGASAIMVEISGRTRVWSILADPIIQVKAPQMLNAVMAEQNVDGVMVPMHVAADDLPMALQGLRRMQNWQGCVVTVPHKSPIVDLLDRVSPAARSVGAVNVVRRTSDGQLVGDILDGVGFVRGLANHGINPRGMSAYLAGAGGAANAIGFALADAGISRLAIANRTASKAHNLVEKIAKAFPSLPVEVADRNPADYDLVINATSLGMKSDDALPFAVDHLTPDQTVAEIIMVPEETAIMAAARAKGCRVHPGRPMLLAQRDLMIEYLGMRNNSSDH